MKKGKKIRKGVAKGASWQASQSSSISLWDCIKKYDLQNQEGWFLLGKSFASNFIIYSTPSPNNCQKLANIVG